MIGEPKRRQSHQKRNRSAYLRRVTDVDGWRITERHYAAIAHFTDVDEACVKFWKRRGMEEPRGFGWMNLEHRDKAKTQAPRKAFTPLNSKHRPELDRTEWRQHKSLPAPSPKPPSPAIQLARRAGLIRQEPDADRFPGTETIAEWLVALHNSQ